MTDYKHITPGTYRERELARIARNEQYGVMLAWVCVIAAAVLFLV